MAWCKQQAIDWANVDRNSTSQKMHLLAIKYIKTTKRTLVGFQPNYTTNFNVKYSSFTSLTARPDNFDSSNFPLIGPENRCVCGCQSAFIAFIASDSNSKHTRKILTDFGLIGTSLRHLDRHFNFVGREEKKLHAIVRSRTVTWLTRWRLPQWSQLYSGIFFLTNATRKHATMLDGTNTEYWILFMPSLWKNTVFLISWETRVTWLRMNVFLLFAGQAFCVIALSLNKGDQVVFSMHDEICSISNAGNLWGFLLRYYWTTSFC